MIIEFLYKKIKIRIFQMQLPSYIANQVLFVAVALVNEQLRTTIYIDTDNKTV